VEQYYEYSVAGSKSKRSEFFYAMCWLLIVICLIAAIFFASGIFADSTRTLTYTGPDALEVNWLCVVGTALCLLAAGILFRRKDHLRMEYDYILRGTVLEVSGIYNARRRRVLAEIPLERILQMGPIRDAQIQKLSNYPQMKHHNWCLNADVPRYYFIYMVENNRHLAFLELNDEIVAAIRNSGKLPRDAWRSEEGKSLNHASLS